MIKKITHRFFLICALVLLVASGFLFHIYYEVTRDAVTRIKRGAIDRVIASESPVLYDDGRTPIGVFFEKTHRIYIPYQNIPKDFIKALVAAEDRNFYEHRGFDLKAILRALTANIRAGRVVQGGSTLTQQTAKNIFRREKRSYRAKLKELFQAFLFERTYTKQEILEMYSNQFFVTGYGKGLGIASQYFFNKPAQDLDLVEAAFIAGSVKGPNLYNPFIKKTDAEKAKARHRAKLRKDYVLSRMMSMHFISRDEYVSARTREVPFREGRITYRLNVIVDYVREQLESEYFKKILRDQGVDNPATSGMRIFTSVNRDIQSKALQSLRRHLPSLDVKLQGLSKGHGTEKQGAFQKSKQGLPFLARITQIDATRENAYLVVSWDKGGGVIGYDGLRPMGEAWLQWKLGGWAVFDASHVDMFLKEFRVGDVVPVRISPSKGGVKGTGLMLSTIPELEGGIVVVREGMVKAMVGGFFNRFFNRAVDAKRQLGSIFKPILYTAALQLKWNILDPLPNTREVYRFQNTIYFPRPDHTPRSDRVSMAWAGAKSENLATVWLLYHLTDHLNMNEFRRVANLVGLVQRKEESYVEYKHRIRDRLGVVVNRDAMMEAALDQAKKDIQSDVIFEGHAEILQNLERLQFHVDEEVFKGQDSEIRRIPLFSFKRLRALDSRMKGKLGLITRHLAEQGRERDSGNMERISRLLGNFYMIRGEKKETARVLYMEEKRGAGASGLFPLTPAQVLQGSWPPKEVWIEGLVTSRVIDQLQDHLKTNYRRLLTRRRYDPEVLFMVRDFRTLVNLSYVVYLSKQIGISTKLDPVLSFPLGPNAISIMEAVLAYQCMMTGRVYPLARGQELGHVPIITRIVDREGETIYEYEPHAERVLSSRVSSQVTEILGKVMEVGTGRRARDTVRASFEGEGEIDVPLPCFGKTGTANRFTNSSFVGFIPAPDDASGGLRLDKGYVIASYVGYDDNRPMKGKHVSVYGASGALPLWIDTANAIVRTPEYQAALEPADLAFDTGRLGLPKPGADMKMVPVSPLTGLPEAESGKKGREKGPLPVIPAPVEDSVEGPRLKRTFGPVDKGPQG
jgi:penicillin-binding protein 1A